MESVLLFETNFLQSLTVVDLKQSLVRIKGIHCSAEFLETHD